jgi:hypothetical protein
MAWFSALMERRALRIWGLVAIVGAIAVATVLFIGMRAAFASHPESSLAGSNFEIDVDANLVRNDPAPSEDWGSLQNRDLANPNAPEIRATDKPTGQTDDSYQGGV